MAKVDSGWRRIVTNVILLTEDSEETSNNDWDQLKLDDLYVIYASKSRDYISIESSKYNVARGEKDIKRDLIIRALCCLLLKDTA